MRFTVHRTISLKGISPVLPQETEMIQVEGADSFEEAMQTLDKCVGERMAVWKNAAENVTAKATEVAGPAQANEPKGQVSVTPPTETTEPQPETPAPTPSVQEAPVASEPAPVADQPQAMATPEAPANAPTTSETQPS